MGGQTIRLAVHFISSLPEPLRSLTDLYGTYGCMGHQAEGAFQDIVGGSNPDLSVGGLKKCKTFSPPSQGEER